MNDKTDLRDALIGASNLRKFRYVFVTVTACIGGFIALIMLCSYLFAAPWHPPAPYHAPYRPSCQGSGVKQVVQGDPEVVNWSYMVVCNDGFSYTVGT